MNAVTPNPMDTARLKQAKAAYATRRIKREDMMSLVRGDVALRAGDLVLARVELVGQHQRIELADGRKSRLFPGDEILLCLGNRYSPDQFEVLIPEEFGSCELIAAGGVAAKVICRSSKVNAATVLDIIGRVTDAHGTILNLENYALPDSGVGTPHQVVLAVVGTTMNAGKTESMTSLIHGLIKAGYKVGAQVIATPDADTHTIRVLDPANGNAEIVVKVETSTYFRDEVKTDPFNYVTVFSSTNSSLVSGDFIEVKGYLSQDGGTLVATMIERLKM